MFTEKSSSECRTPLGLGVLPMAAVPMPQMSVGASSHGKGECRPCAWFHKPQGCRNGADCQHCHLCPEGEIKSRKKAKSARMRHQVPEDDEQVSEEECHQAEVSHKALKPPGLELQGSSVVEPIVLAAPPVGELPSVGSANHGHGDCKPCAWFHKEQGCKNGKECRHCHLCPNDEIKNRKKNKVTVMRIMAAADAAAAEVKTYADTVTNIAYDAAQWEGLWSMMFQPGNVGSLLETTAPVHALEGPAIYPRQLDAFLEAGGELSTSQEEEEEEEEGEEDKEEKDEGEEEEEEHLLSGSAEESLMMPSKVQPHFLIPSVSPPPSSGSILHDTGKCKPCAWFHKPGGCLNGQACCHCHLCPDGEIKARRKVKHAGIRNGALVSNDGKASTRSSRILRISPLL